MIPEKHTDARHSLVTLVAGFALMVALLLALAHHGLWQLADAKARLDQIVLVHNAKLASVSGMQKANRERIIALQQMLIADDFFEIDASAMHNMAMANRFIAARQFLEAMPQSQQEQALLEDLREATHRAAPLNDRIRSMLWDEEPEARDKATALLNTEFRPAQNAIYEVFDRLVALYESTNKNAISLAAQAHAQARYVTFQLLAFLMLASAVTAFLVIRRIAMNEAALKRHRINLESLVSERTAALEQKTAEAETARREAEHANEAKSTFMANMSHELRTPLNAVLGFSEIMTLRTFGDLSERYREYAEHIHGSAAHLLEMIEELLDLSRIEAGRIELSDNEIHLASMLRDSAQMVASAQQRKPADFVFGEICTQTYLRADSRIMRQLLINIMGNAAKFSAAGQRIMIECSADSDGVRIVIRDNGIGIEPEEIPRLFDPYERSRSEIARKCAGTGLGLPISRSLIRAHGGDMQIASEHGVGTTVTLTIPPGRVIMNTDGAAQAA